MLSLRPLYRSLSRPERILTFLALFFVFNLVLSYIGGWTLTFWTVMDDGPAGSGFYHSYIGSDQGSLLIVPRESLFYGNNSLATKNPKQPVTHITPSWSFSAQADLGPLLLEPKQLGWLDFRRGFGTSTNPLHNYPGVSYRWESPTTAAAPYSPKASPSTG